MKKVLMLASVCAAIGGAQAQSLKSLAHAKVESLVRASAQLAMVSDDDSLDVRDVIQDANGDSHTRFHRKYKGLRVIGGDFVAHAQAGGALKGVTHKMRDAIRLNTKPLQSAAAAELYASTQLGRVADSVTSELVIYAIGTPTLAYDVLVSATVKDGLPIRRHYIVDANGLNILNRWDDVHSASSGPVNATGSSQYSGVVPLTTYYQVRDPRTGDWYLLRDVNRGSFQITGAAAGPGYSTSNNNWSGPNIDAMYGQNISWDFYLSKFGRVGGSANYAYFDAGIGSNAYWEVGCACIKIGLGNGTTTQSFAAPDVMGHEYTHGIIASTADLIYGGESGAINESIADVFGTLIEHYAPHKQYPANYLIAERVRIVNNGNSAPVGAGRYMFKPSRDGQSVDCYYPGIGAPNVDVHHSSGVGNRFFYLLAEGATVPANFAYTQADMVCNGNTALQGIGREAAGKIIYRTLTVYLTSSSGYSQYRTGSIQAAIDLYGYGSVQHNAVIAAWAASGVTN